MNISYGEQYMNDETRRNFLGTSGKLFLGFAALGSLTSHAADQHHEDDAGHGLVVDATLQNRCATCQYWGGMRKISNGNKQVIAQSMGWCNNPESPNYEKLTAADHHMKKPGIWEKWAIL
jgi:hypothetical protein